MLYQDKYLIAVYNDKDEFIDCQTSIKAFKKPCPATIRLLLRHKKFPNINNYKVYLIDCTETHDDVFAEEDKIFLQEENGITKEKLLTLYGKQHGISLRTVWRRIAAGKIKPEDLEGFKSVI